MDTRPPSPEMEKMLEGRAGFDEFSGDRLGKYPEAVDSGRARYDDRALGCDRGRAVAEEAVDRRDALGELGGRGRDDDRPGTTSRVEDSGSSGGTGKAEMRSWAEGRRGKAGMGGTPRALPLEDRLKLVRGLGTGIESSPLSSLPDHPSSYANGSDLVLLNDLYEAVEPLRRSATREGVEDLRERPPSLIR